MPIGISFFTFQAMSYVIDVYRKEVPANKNFISFSTYVSLFPQLVAGPIVRYTTINNKLKERNHSFSLFALGTRRFLIGLAKKVLIANTIGELCYLLAYSIEISVLSKWIEAISFTLQIYFDFSGYSDMAIGLGLIFGFKFLENFNYPYISKSITEFWRRWHISLSSWLRDYIYLPLGGNRVPKIKWIRNIIIVWFLTGFWHGASYNFILWGLYFAFILIIEKLFLTNFLKKHKIGLWDMIKSCYVDKSKDSSIKDPEYNDLTTLKTECPQLECICFSSKKAFKYYKRYLKQVDETYKNWLEKMSNGEEHILPSPSSANARMGLDDKIKKWQKLLTQYVKK